MIAQNIDLDTKLILFNKEFIYSNGNYFHFNLLSGINLLCDKTHISSLRLINLSFFADENSRIWMEAHSGVWDSESKGFFFKTTFLINEDIGFVIQQSDLSLIKNGITLDTIKILLGKSVLRYKCDKNHEHRFVALEEKEIYDYIKLLENQAKIYLFDEFIQLGIFNAIKSNLALTNERLKPKIPPLSKSYLDFLESYKEYIAEFIKSYLNIFNSYIKNNCQRYWTIVEIINRGKARARKYDEYINFYIDLEKKLKIYNTPIQNEVISEICKREFPTQHSYSEDNNWMFISIETKNEFALDVEKIDLILSKIEIDVLVKKYNKKFIPKKVLDIIDSKTLIYIQED